MGSEWEWDMNFGPGALRKSGGPGEPKFQVSSYKLQVSSFKFQVTSMKIWSQKVVVREKVQVPPPVQVPFLDISWLGTYIPFLNNKPDFPRAPNCIKTSRFIRDLTQKGIFPWCAWRAGDPGGWWWMRSEWEWDMNFGLGALRKSGGP